MKKLAAILLIAVLIIMPLFASGKKQSQSENEFAYLVGYATAKNLGDQYKAMFGEESLRYALKALIKGVNAYRDGKTVDSAEYQRIQDAFQLKVQLTNEEKKNINLKVAEEFLEKNKLDERVTETETGLQYMVLKEGDGEPVGDNTIVKTSYKMIAGTDYANVVDEGKGIIFDINGLIAGAREGIKLMNVGSKYRLYIHPSLGYGEYGAGDQIPPNSLLIFDVTVDEIIK